MTTQRNRVESRAAARHSARVAEAPMTIATRLAREAGGLIAAAIGRGNVVERKAAVDLVTEIDHASERVILDGLRRSFPDDLIVAEESSSSRPAAGRRCWYVDPLDGTTNFVHGLPHCSVSLALAAANGAPELAVVYDPCKDELFHAVRGEGAFLNDRPIHVSQRAVLDEALFVTGFPYDRREHSSFYLKYFEAFMLRCRDLRRFGSAALDLSYVAAGRFDGFWEWYLKPWDTAAGWLIVEEAGGRVVDFDGAAYDPWAPRILATNGVLEPEALAVLADLARSTA
jgi:myo-inositol-1(or 4)-monophosphatase